MELKDYARVVTPQDLEIKYNLGKLADDRKAIELQRESLNKVENELTTFVGTTTEDLENLQNQVDGNITTWFLSGVPTLSNAPAVDWVTDLNKNAHLGDLYYDQETGYAYRFTISESVYSWLKLTDSDISEALAIANDAKDTADSKRRVFVTTPTTPYEIGDIWVGDSTSELKRCAVARESGDYSASDWIIATKYTDDTVALDTRAVLDEFQNEVVNNYTTNASLVTTSEGIIAQVSGSLSTKADNDEVQIMKTDVANLKLTTDALNITITDIDTNGVNKVVTETGFTFDENGLSISKVGEEMNALIDNTGLYVKRDEEVVLSANNSGVEAENIKVRKYLTVGTNFRLEDYKGGLGFFYVGGE